MDYDIEMEDATGQAAPDYQQDLQDLPPHEDILAIDVDDAQEPGEINEAGEADEADSTLVPTKLHLRGLDALTPDDIKAYIIEHVGTGTGRGGAPYERIEWIDDTSANLIFESEAAAAGALTALAAISIADTAQLPVREPLPAKTYSGKPDDVSAGLSVRLAVASDRKQSGAAARSRFYLLHPEYDPEERRRSQQNRRRDDRGSYRDSRDSRDSRSRNHRSYRDDRDDRDDREEDIRNNSFDVSLYDDDAPALAQRPSDRRRRRSRTRSPRLQSRSRSRSRTRVRRSNNRDKELFPEGTAKGRELFPNKVGTERRGDSRERRSSRERGRESGRLRGRSASPRRDNGAFFYDDNGDDYDGRLADERAEAVAAAASANRNKARAIKDRLSSAKDDGGSSRSNAGRELFPSAAGNVAQMDLFDSTAAVTTRLSDRITRPSDSKQAAGGSSSFNIRGLASSGSGSSSQGFTIKGAASARELFPNKLGGGGSTSNSNGSGGSGGRGRNAGKELFDDNSLASRIQPRPRQRAEDLFH